MFYAFFFFRIVSVGGDGMFAEVVEGLMGRTLKDAGIDEPAPDSILPQPKWRIGIIPAGKFSCCGATCQWLFRSIFGLRWNRSDEVSVQLRLKSWRWRICGFYA